MKCAIESLKLHIGGGAEQGLGDADYRNVEQRLASFTHIDGQGFTWRNVEDVCQRAGENHALLTHVYCRQVLVHGTIEARFRHQSVDCAPIRFTSVAQYGRNDAYRLHLDDTGHPLKLQDNLVGHNLCEGDRHVAAVYHTESQIDGAVETGQDCDHADRQG